MTGELLKAKGVERVPSKGELPSREGSISCRRSFNKNSRSMYAAL